MAAGRKRAFDKEEALETAMKVFWERGYLGTSIGELTELLGINKPSLYAAFGNKEQLFLRALARYGSRYGLPHAQRLLTPEDAPLRHRIQGYLLSIAQMLSDPSLPGGCLFALATCEIGSRAMPDEAVRSITGINSETRRILTEFFASERERGHLARDADPLALATYLMTVLFGMAVMSRNGFGMDELAPSVGLAIEIF
jgi:AcrR family transcriptional regulator